MARALEPERGAEYQINPDGSISYFTDSPSKELREQAEKDAAKGREEAQQLYAGLEETDEPTRDELYAQGRSTMTKDELAETVQSEES